LKSGIGDIFSNRKSAIANHIILVMLHDGVVGRKIRHVQLKKS